MSSTISPARQALWNIISSTFSGGQVQPVIGNPKGFEQQQVVALLGVGPASEDFALLGPGGPNDERFSLAMRIKCHEPDANDGAAADAAGWAIYDRLRDAVRANATLGGVLVTPAHTNSPRTEGAFQPEDASGWAIFIDFTIDCFGRAT